MTNKASSQVNNGTAQGKARQTNGNRTDLDASIGTAQYVPAPRSSCKSGAVCSAARARPRFTSQQRPENGASGIRVSILGKFLSRKVKDYWVGSTTSKCAFVPQTKEA